MARQQLCIRHVRRGCALPGIWALGGSGELLPEDEDETYFLVSEQSEHRYRMVAVQKDSCNRAKR